MNFCILNILVQFFWCGYRRPNILDLEIVAVNEVYKFVMDAIDTYIAVVFSQNIAEQFSKERRAIYYAGFFR